MKNRLTGLLLAALTGLTAVAAAAQETFSADHAFGAPMPAEGATLSLGQAIERIDSLQDEFVKIEGLVTEVCQAKGCWMILMEGDTYARITFEDYGFFVPIETSMQRTVVYGRLSEQTLSGETAEHYAQDAGAQATLKLEGVVREYSIVARAVQLEDPA